jgi:hypothetical protein
MAFPMTSLGYVGILGRELMPSLAVRLLSVPTSVITMSYYVPCIILGSAQIEMVKKYTRWIITKMKHVFSVSDRPTKQYPPCPMSIHHSALIMKGSI